MEFMARVLGALVKNQSDGEMPGWGDAPRTPTLTSTISAQPRSFWDKPCPVHTCRKWEPIPYFLDLSVKGCGCDAYF